MSSSITTKTNKADIPWLANELRSLYWGKTYTDEQVIKAVSNSLCFWVHRFEAEISEPIGFARVLTDGVLISTITDFFVIRECRRQGVGKALMQYILQHDEVKKTICILASRDAAKFYGKFGFVNVPDPVLGRPPQ